MSISFPSKKQALKLLPLIVLISLVVYSFKGYEKRNELEDVFKQQKVVLESQLDRIMDDYKQMSVKNKRLSKRLIKEMNKIIALKKSVKKLEKDNYRLIAKYTRKIVQLERKNRSLFLQVDSLSTNNKKLIEQNTLVKTKLKTDEASRSKLLKSNEKLEAEERKLASKISGASIVKTSKITVTAVKETRRGKLRSTSRARKTDAVKVEFSLLSNAVAEPGKKEIIIQLIDEDNNVVNPKGEEKLNKHTSITYSDYIPADYQNEKLGVVSLISVERGYMSKGKYTVAVYVGGKLSGKSTFKLK